MGRPVLGDDGGIGEGLGILGQEFRGPTFEGLASGRVGDHRGSQAGQSSGDLALQLRPLRGNVALDQRNL
ncbi:hypothetical protein [Dankookia sp. P2]|uniref:hypothetical protein n=1 Tax=Dankookia sp. P2 TaxID=3423955 RepID=UPI003D665687